MNSIFKLSIVLTVLSATSLADELKDQGVIIGPTTPLFNITLSGDTGPKPDRIENVFPPSRSYIHFLDPKNQEGVYFINIMVIFDDYFSRFWNNSDISKLIWDRWNKLDGYFAQLDSPKIRIKVAAVMTFIDPLRPQISITDKSYTDESIIFWQRAYPEQLFRTKIETTLKWMHNSCEKLFYDTYILMSDNVLMLEKMAYLTSPGNVAAAVDLCPDKSKDFSPKGVMVYAGYKFESNAAFLIAQMLGVDFDDDSKCGADYLMNKVTGPNAHGTWSECSKEGFQKILNTTKFDCLKKIEYEVQRDNSKDL